MTSKFLRIFLFAGISAFVAISGISCAPTAPGETGTTALISAPSSLALTRADSVQSSATSLTCGCSFLLSVTGYGGDTNIIHFSFAEPRDSLSTIHNVIATIRPSTLKSSGQNSAWIGFYTTHDSTSTNAGTHLFDTLRVTATY